MSWFFSFMLVFGWVVFLWGWMMFVMGVVWVFVWRFSIVLIFLIGLLVLIG